MVARALDLLPDAVAGVLGLGLGAALVIAGTRAIGWWALLLVVASALGLGLRVGARPPAVGKMQLAVSAAAVLALTAGLFGVAMVPARKEVPSWQALAPSDAEPMRLDLGESGADATTGGRRSDEGRGTSTGDGASTAAEASTRPEGSSSGGEVEPETPRRSAPHLSSRPLFEPPRDDTTGGSEDTASDTSGGELVVAVAEQCRDGMTFIEGGRFEGRDVASFCLDTTEVTVRSYERCVRDGACSKAGCNKSHIAMGTLPEDCVDWEQAKAFCAHTGKRLPTSREWKWAARGRGEGRTYPWGEEEPTCERVVMRGGCGKDGTWPVGSKWKGDSRDGVKDLAGNVFEWTSTADGESRFACGGTWSTSRPEDFRSSFCHSFNPRGKTSYVGFRCARNSRRPQ